LDSRDPAAPVGRHQEAARNLPPAHLALLNRDEDFIHRPVLRDLYSPRGSLAAGSRDTPAARGPGSMPFLSAVHQASLAVEHPHAESSEHPGAITGWNRNQFAIRSSPGRSSLRPAYVIIEPPAGATRWIDVTQFSFTPSRPHARETCGLLCDQREAARLKIARQLKRAATSGWRRDASTSSTWKFRGGKAASATS